MRRVRFLEIDVSCRGGLFSAHGDAADLEEELAIVHPQCCNKCTTNASYDNLVVVI